MIGYFCISYLLAFYDTKRLVDISAKKKHSVITEELTPLSRYRHSVASEKHTQFFGLCKLDIDVFIFLMDFNYPIMKSEYERFTR